MTRDAKMSRLLATFNTLPDRDKKVVIQFSESMLYKDRNDKNMIKTINNSRTGLHTGEGV
ncbi:hypothetical protein FACS1894142_2820 [Spirochaetia bacterium]|nr:hypothetical protein FACS1894142_2820 [Spirochaetia bacterium]